MRKNMSNFRSITLLLSLVCLTIFVKKSVAVVTLENNGYKGLVVAIHKNIPEDPKLIDRIKEMLTKASEQLYSATKRRAFFEEVTIVVPSTWTYKDGRYEVVQGGDRFTKADVRVDEPNPTFGDTPYTEQPGECGEPGEYIHLTPEFLIGQLKKLEEAAAAENGEEPLGDQPKEDESHIVETYDENPFGDLGRVFVHEWAHLRYGTFDEHGYQSDEQMPLFYADKDNKIHPTGCSDDVRGWLLDTAGDPCILDINGMPNSKCVFYPDLNSTDDSEGPSKPSLMYLPALNDADGFCDDDESSGRKHNSLAPNKQNIMCSGRSTWDVVSKHPDFGSGANAPRNLVSLIPKFRVIQPKQNQRPTFVLVLDISGSMKGRRIELLRAATSRFIKFQLADFCMVGMVSFSTGSKLLSNMTALDDVTREQLLKQVPQQDDEGFTAIGTGIQQAIQMLRDNREPTDGTLLLLVSDGEENVEPFINDIIPEIKQSKVVINTVAFGRAASSKLENLVKITGGRGFFYDDEKVSHNMLDTAFVESAATHADVELQPLEIVNRHLTLKGYEQKEGDFLVDKEVGRSTVFLATYDYPVPPEQQEPLEVVIWNPSGKKYSSSSAEYSTDRNTLSISVKFPQADPGRWKYWVKNRLSDQMDVTLLVSSETSDVREQPVRVRAWVSDLDFSFPSKVKVYAEVKKGYNAVVDASVIGTIGRPLGEPWVIMLFDNGAGADTVAGDGIYSAYFAHFNGSGRYSVEATVVNNGRARISLANEQGGSRAPRMAVLPKGQKDHGGSQSSFDPTELKQPTDAELLEDMEDRYNQKFRNVHYEPIDEFERYASAGAFKLSDFKDGDVIPPSRVTDLKIIEANLPERRVKLRWTSAGDDMEDGQGVLTEVRYHQDPLFLLKSFSRSPSTFKVLEGTLTPPLARQPHEVVIEMMSEAELQLNVSNNRLYFAVRTLDEAGNEGEVSNLAMAHFQDPAITARIIRGNSPNLHYILWAIVAGVVAIVIILAVVLIICKFKANRKKKYECQKRQGVTTATNGHQTDRLLA
ncbi:chloride channel [Chamberlinius hualienensis]